MSGICPRCETKCYAAEGVEVNKHWYHNTCFKCKQCDKGLQLTTYFPEKKSDEIYCKSCHGSLFGPGGFGHGTSIGVVTYSAVSSGGMTVDGKRKKVAEAARDQSGAGANGAGANNPSNVVHGGATSCKACGVANPGKFCQECGAKS